MLELQTEVTTALPAQPIHPASKRPAIWLAVARAVFELALARLRLGVQQAGDLAPEAALPDAEISSAGKRLAGRLAYVIPRVARRMPWRSDCLIQAMAARRWLEAKGVRTRLHIGSRKSVEKGFEAHAWITVGDLVVTGWDIDNFEQFAAFPSPRAKATAS